MIRARTTTWDSANGRITAAVLGGPEIQAVPVGYWPAPGFLGWYEQVAPGSWICLGPVASEGSYNTYTPVVTASTTNPTLGANSIQNGRWTRIGREIHVTGFVNFGGAGFAAGSGDYRVSLPVDVVTSGVSLLGNATFEDSSPAGYYNGAAYRVTSSTFSVVLDGALGIWGSANPVVLAQTDIVGWHIRMEI